MMTSSPSHTPTKFSRKTFAGIFFALVSLALFAWSLINYRIQPTQPIFYGSRAIYSTLLLAFVLALLGRILLLRILKLEIGSTPEDESHHSDTWRVLLLLDVVAPIYLTAGVLLGLVAAVLVALVTQFVVQGYTFMRGLISWPAALYHVATTGILVLISAALFGYIKSLFHVLPHMGTSYLESWELIATLLTTVVMTLLIVLVSLPVLMQNRQIGLRAAWHAYYHSPVLRFQILVMSVTPLLPVVDIFDNEVAELAWTFFLVPLLAIYYLALISTRLSLRTEELQHTLEDLNSARRRQDELRGYASLITRVQEEERKRLARELHDDTAQALIALARGLDGLGRAVEKQQLPQKDRAWLASLHELADHTLESVRRACRDLRPSILDDLGLRAALEWLCDSSSSRGIASHFSCTGAILATTPEAEIAIFRIAQEALSNVWRHAQAMSVEVELVYQSDSLCLRIQDDGRGFWPEQITSVQHDSQSGLGLLGMRERAMLVGAELTIDAQPGSGCMVVLRLPLEAAVRDLSVS
ncbi:MAG TPA: sensor histidine kinase [Ktedonobacteraceae bacterium]